MPPLKGAWLAVCVCVGRVVGGGWVWGVGGEGKPSICVWWVPRFNGLTFSKKERPFSLLEGRCLSGCLKGKHVTNHAVGGFCMRQIRMEHRKPHLLNKCLFVAMGHTV